MKLLKSIFIFFICSNVIIAQNMEDYTASWEGKFTNNKAFNLSVEISNLESENPTLKIANTYTIVNTNFKAPNKKDIRIHITNTTSFRGYISNDNKEISGFIKSGILLYHVKLVKNASNIYKGKWNVFMTNKLSLKSMCLSIENGNKNNYEAYPFFADNAFTGTWAANFKKDKHNISFTDFKTGLNFKGKLHPKKIDLGVYLGEHLITQVELNKLTSDWKKGKNQQEISRSNHKILNKMESKILDNSFVDVHSVLISKRGKTIYEQYFNGYNKNVPHDTRSASKSIGSAIVGIAKEKGLFDDVNQPFYTFLPEKAQEKITDSKRKIDIKSLLTMSSGLDADDYTRKRKSLASEGSYQSSRNWLQTVLNAPMLHKPNTHANYGSANPYLLGVAMSSVVNEPLELFMDKYLFKKLNISNYIIQTDLNGKPYFGGGMYVTPKDLLKFGEMYRCDGKWNKEQVLSKKWVRDSFKNYRILENVPEKNGYGYLWWHHTYNLKGEQIKTIEARGNGGQYVFVIPSLKSVVVMTAGNYRNGKTQQPETIFKEYVLRFLMQ